MASFRALLFSSDEEVVSPLQQALVELDFDVEHCSEIFAAVEKVTGKCYEVVLVDWDAEPEASFLLKTVRELKTARESLALAIVSEDRHATSALHSGANSALNKPIVPAQVKETLGTARELILARRSGLSGEQAADLAEGQENAGESVPEEVTPHDSRPSLTDILSQPVAEPIAESLDSPDVAGLPVLAPDTAYADAVFSSPPYAPESLPRPGSMHGFRIAVLSTLLLGVAILYVLAPGSAYIERLTGGLLSRFGDDNNARSARVPSQSPKPAVSLNVERTASARPVHPGTVPQPSDFPEESSANDQPGDIQVVPVTSASSVPTATSAAAQPDAPSASPQAEEAPAAVSIPPAPLERKPSTAFAPAPQPQAKPVNVSSPSHSTAIPESLRTSVAPPQNVSSKPAPSFHGALEPVSLPEEASKQLLIRQVQPAYPEQALRAGLEGAVVLQVLIDKDGSIRDLKLIRGSLLLGQAAFEAVKQWRFKPYYLNGQAVETQTLITVNFKRPS